MRLKERIEIAVRLGEYLKSGDERLKGVMQNTYEHNGWFTVSHQEQAIAAIADKFLSKSNLEQWLAAYSIPQATEPRTVGLILAGNIPLVGFHDLLCVFMAGHRAKIKLSDKDPYWIPHLLQVLQELESATSSYFICQSRLSDFEAVIATGSNNSARYFEAYFGKHPNIIRRNRNAVAVLDGKETHVDLLALGLDVFQYFGLGCRNVSKLYVPDNYVFEPLLDAFYEYREIVLNNKYKNNFDYHYAIYIINRIVFLANNAILLREQEAIASPIANLHYEFYSSLSDVQQKLLQQADQLQVVVSNLPLSGLPLVGFGKTQSPELWDYADGEDTMLFLLGL
ncbi:MAG: acyl-CoA reductase [Saprospiraceae bacterium]|nr:acyl-CoA reductase [Saprospiraceae bacterium]